LRKCLDAVTRISFSICGLTPSSRRL